LERIRAEHKRAISEAKKFREEYARSCTLDNSDKTLQGVGDNQGMVVMIFQMTVLQKKAERAGRELKDIKGKHERELRHERDKNPEKEKIIEQERQKNELLKEELRTYEESILQGMTISGSKIRNNSYKESPDFPKHKIIKIGEEESSDKLEESRDKLIPKDNSSDEIIKIKKEVPQDNTGDLKMVPMFVDDKGKLHYSESTCW
jgi:hypothetical protein